MAKKVKKIAKQQTVKEFKAWLAGITEFQADDWVPNFEQWQSIKDRILQLSEEIEVKTVEKIIHTAGNINSSGTNTPNFQPDNINPNSFMHRPVGPNQIKLLPEGDGAPLEVINVPVESLNMTGAATIPNIHTLSSEVKAPSFSGQKFKTPHDISGQPYKSKFS